MLLLSANDEQQCVAQALQLRDVCTYEHGSSCFSCSYMLTDERVCEQLDSCCGRSWRLCARQFAAADSEPRLSYATAERRSSCCAGACLHQRSAAKRADSIKVRHSLQRCCSYMLSEYATASSPLLRLLTLLLRSLAKLHSRAVRVN
jgi:hypothetical protein